MANPAKMLRKTKHRNILLIAVLLGLSALLVFWPSDTPSNGVSPVKATVQGVVNTFVETYGVVNQGDQEVTVELSEGPLRGKSFSENNILLGDPELDWLFAPGENALVSVTQREGTY